MTKKFWLHCLPAKVDGPALGLIRKALLSVTGLADRLQDVGEDRTDDEIDLVALDEALDLGDGDIGLQFVVDDDHFGIGAAELAAERLDREVEAVADLAAEHRRRARQRDDDADLDLALCLRIGCDAARDQSRHRAARGQRCLKSPSEHAIRSR